MANEEQLAILRQGAQVWNKWRGKSTHTKIDLSQIDLREEIFVEANFKNANLQKTYLIAANLWGTDFSGANLSEANFREADMVNTKLKKANLSKADLEFANLDNANFKYANLSEANLMNADFGRAELHKSVWKKASLGGTIFALNDMSQAIGLDEVNHYGPSSIGVETIQLSQGKIPDIFLRGCGLSDWQIESAKLYNPELSNQAINDILYKMYDLRASQALQFSPLFISYSHSDRTFVDKLEGYLNDLGVRFWRDIHDMRSGRMEKQIDRAIRQNPTVLLILSQDSLKSDWVEHEVRTARQLEKEMGRDVLCPVALDDSWKNSAWPKRVMEQVMEYNILDFSDWKDDNKFGITFNKLIDGLELFYKR